jgi:hypothetical protein
MTLSPSKDCWSRYDIDANFRVLAEWLGPDFPRAMTFPELQWLSGAQEYRASGNFESWRGDLRQSRRQPARPPSTPIDSMFSFCSHGAPEYPDVNASQRSKKSEAETTALVEAQIAEAIASCGGDVHAALRATLVANACLEAEIERLTEAISTGFARGRMRKAPQRITKI